MKRARTPAARSLPPPRVSELLRHLGESAELDRAARDRLARGVQAVLDAPVEEPGGLEALARATLGAAVGVDAAAVLAREDGAFQGRAAIGMAEGPDPLTLPESDVTLAAEAVRGRRTVLASSTSGFGPPFAPGTQAALAVPLWSRGEPVGVLLAGSRSAPEIGEEDQLLLRLAAERAGRALERAALVAALSDAERIARQTSSFRDQILGIVGHDLRNPLGAIVMSSALLQKRGGLEGWQEKTVGRIRSSAARMERIITDLLSYTRTRLGTGIPIEPRPADLAVLTRKVVDELTAFRPECPIAVSADGDLRGEWDPGRLEQVLSNLVSNAVDHGEPDCEVAVALRGTPAGVEAEIANRGEVPPDLLGHVFEPFRRGPDEGGRRASGLGLGLFIAKEIVRRHGGDIAIRSGGGETRLRVTLPRRTVAAPQGAPVPAAG